MKTYYENRIIFPTTHQVRCRNLKAQTVRKPEKKSNEGALIFARTHFVYVTILICPMLFWASRNFTDYVFYFTLCFILCIVLY